MMSDDLNCELPFFVEPAEEPLRFDAAFIQALDQRRADEWRARRANTEARLHESQTSMVAFVWKD